MNQIPDFYWHVERFHWTNPLPHDWTWAHYLVLAYTIATLVALWPRRSR